MALKLNPIGAWLGSERLRNRVLAPEITRASALNGALDALSDRWNLATEADKTDDGPVFIFSAGWGSGSTLVQRLVMSSGEILVWGEPLDQAAPIQRLAMMVATLRDEWPPDNQFIAGRRLDALSGEWVANLIPALEHFRRAHRDFLRSWLAGPDVSDNGLRWGVKEVRLTVDHARYLKWLFPGAKFIFLYRDLYKSYLSCKGVNWLSVWPDKRVAEPLAFAHHWKYLLEGFLNHADELGARLIRYEDILAGKLDLQALSGYLGLKSIDETLLDRNIGSRSRKKKRLNPYEKFILDTVAGDLRRKAGYA